MDTLKAFGLCALLAAPAHPAQPCGRVVQVSSSALARWKPPVEAASRRFGIPQGWIYAVMARESAGLTMLQGSPILSRAGAMGLMQLMPHTWSDMRIRYGLGNDPFDPKDNIFAGTAYLREMFDHYGYPDLFAAYHAGPGRLDAALAGLKPLPDATRIYLQSIVPGVEIDSIFTPKSFATHRSSDPDTLFFLRATDEKSPAVDESGTQRLFVPLASQRSSSAL